MGLRPKWPVFLIISLVFLSVISSASASPPVRIAAGVVSNVASALFKWLWSLNAPEPRSTNTITGRSLIKFEGGYAMETVFDGSKLGIEPYTLEVSPSGEFIILDSANSNVHKVSSPLSTYSRPKLVTGSQEGYTGHVDGKLRDAKMHNPKSVAVDDRGNIYIADTMNMAVRKISSDSGLVTTIAGGRTNREGDVKLSDDFEVVYVRSSCSLIVVDRGNHLIREIQLHYDDCNESQLVELEGNYHLGIAVLFAVAFFGYMLALLQQRVRSFLCASQSVSKPYHVPPRKPLIPNEEELEKGEEGLFTSFGRLIYTTISTCFELIIGGIFASKNKSQIRAQIYQQPIRHFKPERGSYVIQDHEQDEVPIMESRSPRKDARDLERFYHNRQQVHGRVVEDEFHHQRQQEALRAQQQVQSQVHPHGLHPHPHPQRHYSPKGCCERGAEPNEILFGAVQEQDGRRETVVIKAVDYSELGYNHQNIRPRVNYMGYASSYNY